MTREEGVAFAQGYVANAKSLSKEKSFLKHNVDPHHHHTQQRPPRLTLPEPGTAPSSSSPAPHYSNSYGGRFGALEGAVSPSPTLGRAPRKSLFRLACNLDRRGSSCLVGEVDEEASSPAGWGTPPPARALTSLGFQHQARELPGSCLLAVPNHQAQMQPESGSPSALPSLPSRAALLTTQSMVSEPHITMQPSAAFTPPAAMATAPNRLLSSAVPSLPHLLGGSSSRSRGEKGGGGGGSSPFISPPKLIRWQHPQGPGDSSTLSNSVGLSDGPSERQIRQSKLLDRDGRRRALQFISPDPLAPFPNAAYAPNMAARGSFPFGGFSSSPAPTDMPSAHTPTQAGPQHIPTGRPSARSRSHQMIRADEPDIREAAAMTAALFLQRRRHLPSFLMARSGPDAMSAAVPHPIGVGGGFRHSRW